MPGAGKPESEREQAREKPSHNLPAEAERQMAVQEKESQRQELLARVREKIFGNVFGREHSQGKAGDMEPRAFGNISGREHSQGKAGAMEPRAFGNMPKSYLPEEEQKGRFEKASAEKAMRNAPHGGGNMPPGSFLSEEEIPVEAKKTWDARKGLPGKFKETQEIGGMKAYDNGTAWAFKVGLDKTLMVSKDHPRLQEIAKNIAQAQQAIDAGDEAAEDKFLAQAARLEQGKK